MARRQHVLSGPRSGEAEQAAFQALCHAKQEKFAAAYTACNQPLQISEDLPDPTCLIVSLKALAIIQIWHAEPAAALAAFGRPQVRKSDGQGKGGPVRLVPGGPRTIKK